MSGPTGRARLLELFDRLNEKLTQADQQGELQIVGGAMMALAHDGKRVTEDIDSHIGRALLAFSVLAAAYFAFLALDFYVFKLDSILLGVVRELLTIPLIPAVAAAFVFSVVRLLSNRRSVNAGMVSAALILFAVNCVIWGSFVF
ncbi:MAG: hypothetical protein OXQ89_07230 [Rhodospirillaceae bacterium]|nr:hypothetical protein [Rhodospirillaceae bacterium]